MDLFTMLSTTTTMHSTTPPPPTLPFVPFVICPLSLTSQYSHTFLKLCHRAVVEGFRRVWKIIPEFPRAQACLCKDATILPKGEPKGGIFCSNQHTQRERKNHIPNRRPLFGRPWLRSQIIILSYSCKRDARPPSHLLKNRWHLLGWEQRFMRA